MAVALQEECQAVLVLLFSAATGGGLGYCACILQFSKKLISTTILTHAQNFTFQGISAYVPYYENWHCFARFPNTVYFTTFLLCKLVQS
jgi:hypothetical protein